MGVIGWPTVTDVSCSWDITVASEKHPSCAAAGRSRRVGDVAVAASANEVPDFMAL